MAAIDQIVQVQITQTSSPISQASFAVPLIMGNSNPNWSAGDYIHSYSSAAGMLTDGFQTTAPEYIWASALFGNSITPNQFMVAKRSTKVAQVSTLAVNTLGATGTVYSVNLNGTTLSYTSIGGDTQQSILAALNTQAVATGLVTGAVTGTGGSALDTLTASAPGQTLTFSGATSNITTATTTQPNGLAQDIANAIAQNNGWYCLLTPGATDADILQAATYIQTLPKIYMALSSTTAVAGSGTTDIASQLKAASFSRTALFYSPANFATGPDATWVGGQLPQTPGSNNWAFKTLPGQVPDALSQTAIANLIGNPVAGTKGKNANIYQTVGGVNITQMGTMASGQFIDITIGLDWLQANIQNSVFAALQGATKIPYTDVGVGILIQAVLQPIQQGITNGLIDGTTAYSVTAPKVATVSTAQRANRVGPPIAFSCRLQGAVNAVLVQGSVSF